jgi:ceramide glucosyltransferase
MDTISVIGIAATGWWMAAVTVHAAAAVASFIQPGVRRRAAVRADRPAVSILIPVKNVEPELERAFVSVFSQRYPSFEVIIAAAERESPAISVARSVASRFPDVACRFILGTDRLTLNPKVSNLVPAIAAANNNLILIKDASIELRDGQVADFIGELTPGTGMVCAVPIAIHPRTFWATVECTEVNGRSAPLMMGASILGLNVGFGKVMLFRSADFEAVDGLSVMAPTFGDDHALAKAFARIGLRTVFASSVIRQAMGARTFRDVWERQSRWMVIRRVEAPLVFAGEIFFGGLFATIAGAVGFACLKWPVTPALLGTPILWLAIEAAVVAAKDWGWSWRYPLAAICREFILVPMWLHAWFSRNVQWSGQPFEVGGQPHG